MKVSGVLSKVKAFQMLMSGSEYYDQGAGNVVCVVIKERSLGRYIVAMFGVVIRLISAVMDKYQVLYEADHCGDGQVLAKQLPL